MSSTLVESFVQDFLTTRAVCVHRFFCINLSVLVGCLISVYIVLPFDCRNLQAMQIYSGFNLFARETIFRSRLQSFFRTRRCVQNAKKRLIFER